MADEQNSNGQFDPVIRPFIELWSEYAKQANDATRDFLDGIDDGADVKTWQRRWFDAISKSMDAYMRSPAFLQTVKQNTDTAIKFKQHADDVATEFARNANIPTAGDISGLFERLHSIEELILSRLGRIEQRLQGIEKQLAATEVAANPS